MRKLALFYLILFPFLLYAQKEIKKNWALTLTPSIIPLPNARFGIQPGIACQLNPRLAILTAFTFRVGTQANPDSFYRDQKYFRVMSELRYFLNSTVDKTYVGLQASYTARSFTSRHNSYHDNLPDDSVVFYDYAKVNSPIITTSIQVGMMIPCGKHFQLDWFLGLGMRCINTNYTDVTNPQKAIEFPHMVEEIIPVPRISPAFDYQGVMYRAHFNCGLRFFYFFHHM